MGPVHVAQGLQVMQLKVVLTHIRPHAWQTVMSHAVMLLVMLLHFCLAILHLVGGRHHVLCQVAIRGQTVLGVVHVHAIILMGGLLRRRMVML